MVTNRHVVDGAWMVAVHFRDHGVFYATEWFVHPHADLAVIQLEAENFPQLCFDKVGFHRGLTSACHRQSAWFRANRHAGDDARHMDGLSDTTMASFQ